LFEGDERFNQRISVKSKVITIALLSVALVGCSNDNHSNAASTQVAPADEHPEDATAVSILKMPQLWGEACDKIGDPKVIERLSGTASANNRPAHIIGVQFVCVSNFGNKNFTQYVSWMENSDTGKLECILHNEDRNKLTDSNNWYACGGNLKLNH
jgi:hypothetical protein